MRLIKFIKKCWQRFISSHEDGAVMAKRAINDNSHSEHLWLEARLRHYF